MPFPCNGRNPSDPTLRCIWDLLLRDQRKEAVIFLPCTDRHFSAG